MKTLITLLGATVLMASQCAFAGEAKITWHDLNDFTDVRPASDVKGAFHKRVKSQFEKHFNFEAANLPEGYTFNAEIKNIDLAGDVRFGGMNEFRIIKPIYIPRIEFSYSVADKNGAVVNEGDVKLKDMQFMDRIRSAHDDDEFYYDRRMISRWFQDTLYPALNITPEKTYR